jgi:hypothetical protein
MSTLATSPLVRRAPRVRLPAKIQKTLFVRVMMLHTGLREFFWLAADFGRPAEML